MGKSSPLVFPYILRILSSMLFKLAISIVDAERPYRLHVALPDGQGRFIVYEFKFYRDNEALILAMDYFTEYLRDPGSIVKFHEDILSKREKQSMLPFGKDSIFNKSSP